MDRSGSFPVFDQGINSLANSVQGGENHIKSGLGPSHDQAQMSVRMSGLKDSSLSTVTTSQPRASITAEAPFRPEQPSIISMGFPALRVANRAYCIPSREIQAPSFLARFSSAFLSGFANKLLGECIERMNTIRIRALVFAIQIHLITTDNHSIQLPTHHKVRTFDIVQLYYQTPINPNFQPCAVGG